jgi:NAD+ kinase
VTIGKHAPKQKPVLSLDGQTNYYLHKGDQIIIKISDTPLQLILNPKRRYFEVLRAKLKWGERG